MKKKLLSTLLVLALVLALLPTGAAALVINDQPKPWEIYEYDETYFNSWNDYLNYLYQNGYIDANGNWIHGNGNYYEDGDYYIDYSYDNTKGYVSGPNWADQGDFVSFSVMPKSGYEVDTISVWSYGNYETVSSGTSFWMPNSNVTVYITFKQTDNVWDDGDYRLSCSVDPWRGATATFYDENNNAIASADANENVTLVISAANGYKIDSVRSDYFYNVTSDSPWYYDGTYFTYSFTMPATNVGFYADLTSEGEYDISTTTSGYYGTITVSGGITSADKGDIVSFTVSPYNNYIVEDVTVYADNWGTVTVYRDEKNWNSYYFYMPDSDVEIHATYTNDYHEITMDVGRNGTAVPQAQPSGYFGYVYYGIDGDSIYIDVTPDKGYQVKSITATDELGRRVSVYEAVKENQYYFTMPESDVTISVEFSYRILTNPFTDVKTGDWFYDAVSYVYTEGLMTGTGTYTFSPSAPTSRAMLVTILWRLQGEPYVSGSSFNDVKSSAYYYDAVRWAARYGIVEGYEGNVFKPDDAITREQFAAILYRYAEYCKYSTSASTNLSAYKDNAKVSSWAGTAMKWAVAKGLFEGDNLGNLDPQGQTTRAAAAKLLMAFCENVAS